MGDSSRTSIAVLLATGLALAAPSARAGSCWDEWRNATGDDPWHSPSVDCVARNVEELAIRYDDAQLYVIGTSVDGRLIRALRITADPESADSWSRPSMLVNGGIHGDEHGSVRNLLDWAAWLLEAPNATALFGTTTRTRDLLAQRQLWIVTMVNPDGYDGDGDPSRCNANTIDMNRDFPATWANNNAITTCRRRTGTTPLSQPETRALVGFIRWVQPAIHVDFHGRRTSIVAPTTASPCPTPTGQQRGIMGGGNNWVITMPRAQFTFQPATGTSTQSYAQGGAILQGPAGDLTWRDDALNPNNLPRLTEFTLAGDLTDRRYAPYAASFACDSTRTAGNEGQRTAWFNGQLQAYAPSFEGGAVGLLHEQLKEHFTQPPSTATAVVQDPSINYWERTDSGNPRDSETLTRSVAQDVFYPLGRLLQMADNPLPAAARNAGTGWRDAVVARLDAPISQCDALRTFPPRRPGVDPFERLGVHGRVTPRCTVANWGDGDLGSTQVTLTIDDLDASGIERSQNRQTTLTAGDRRTVSFSPFVFTKGRTYRVTCAITSTANAENDAPVVTIIGDQGCSAWATAGARLPAWCTANAASNGGWDAVTNLNARTVEFTARYPVDTVCAGGRPAVVSSTGQPIASVLPAVFRP